jgi:hypothetical protein
MRRLQKTKIYQPVHARGFGTLFSETVIPETYPASVLNIFPSTCAQAIKADKADGNRNTTRKRYRIRSFYLKTIF